MIGKKLMVGLLAVSMGVSCVPLSHPVPVFAEEPAPAGVRQFHYAQLDRGVRERLCQTCGYKATKAVPSSGHDISEAYQSNVSEHWQECSCGERANVDVHAFGEWSTVKKETADSDGLREHACTVCGYVEQEAIPAMHVKHSYGKMYGHDTKKHWKLCDECGHPGKKKAHGFGEWKTTKQATITETGSQERTCKACGYVETRVLATIPVDPATNEPQAPVSQSQTPAEVKQPSGSGNAPSQAPYQPRAEASGSSQGEPATGNYGQDGNGSSHSDTDETGQDPSRPSDETGHEPSGRTSEMEGTSGSRAARTDAGNEASSKTSNDSTGGTASGGAMDAMDAGSKDGTKKSNVPTLEETAAARRKTAKSNLFLMLGGIGILFSAVIGLILCKHNAQMADGFEEDDEADE